MKVAAIKWKRILYLEGKLYIFCEKLTMQFLGIIWEPKWEVRTACLPADHVRSQLNRNDVTFADPFAVAVQLQFISINLLGSDPRFFKWILFWSFYLFWVSSVYIVWKVSEYWCFIQIVCCRYKAYLAPEIMGAIHSTKVSGNFGPKLNGSVRSNRKSFEKTGPPFEVVLFSRSDRSECWLNGSRPISASIEDTFCNVANFKKETIY